MNKKEYQYGVGDTTYMADDDIIPAASPALSITFFVKKEGDVHHLCGRIIRQNFRHVYTKSTALLFTTPGVWVGAARYPQLLIRTNQDSYLYLNGIDAERDGEEMSAPFSTIDDLIQTYVKLKLALAEFSHNMCVECNIKEARSLRRLLQCRMA